MKCWVCGRELNDLKRDLPKNLWDNNCTYFTSYSIKGKMTDGSIKITHNNKYYEYSFLETEVNLCLVCDQIVTSIARNELYRFEFKGDAYFSYDEPIRHGIYDNNQAQELAQIFHQKNLHKDKEKIQNQLESKFGTVYGGILIEDLVHRKKKGEFPDAYFDIPILIPRLAKELEGFMHTRQSIGEDSEYSLEGEKLINHLERLIMKICKEHKQVASYNPSTQILKVQREKKMFQILENWEEEYYDISNALESKFGKKIFEEVLRESS